jgi:hypothetical protein
VWALTSARRRWWADNLSTVRNLPANCPYPTDGSQTEVFDLEQSLSRDRLSDQIKELREKARGLPAGDERDELLRKAEQDEIALRLIEWITSSGQLPPLRI